MLRVRGLGWVMWYNVLSTWYSCYIRKYTAAVFIWIRPAQDQNSSIGKGLLRSYLRWGANQRLWPPWEWESFFWTLLNCLRSSEWPHTHAHMYITNWIHILLKIIGQNREICIGGSGKSKRGKRYIWLILFRCVHVWHSQRIT